MKKIGLSDHFNVGKMLRFTMPSVFMMIFTSIYGVVDGFFISNDVGADAFAAVNLVLPFIMVLGAVGTVFGSGGSALVSIHLGMGEKQEANRIFSFIVYAAVAIGVVLSILGFVLARPVAIALGATEEMLPYCVLYTRINMIGNVPFILQYMFQVLMVTAARPQLGLGITLCAGFSNMFLDWLLVGVLHFGVAGAAWATFVSQTVGGVLPLLYFVLPNSSALHLGRTRLNLKWLFETVTNGASEFLSSVSTSVVSMLYNHQLLRYYGSYGVAAYGVLMYASFIFTGVYFGFSMGIAPVVSYHYGADDKKELKGLFRRSLFLITVFMAVLTVLAEIFSAPIVSVFVGYDDRLMQIAVLAFRLYSLAYIFMGYNVFGSNFFTALGNGPVSAVISFGRTLVFQVLSVILLPLIFGMQGIWCASLAAECMALLVTSFCLVHFRKKYGYA